MERIVEALRAKHALRDAATGRDKQRCRNLGAPLKCSTTFSTKCCGPYFKALNVFRYITVRTAYASLTALFLTLVLGPVGDSQIAGAADRPVSFGKKARKSHKSKAGNADDGRSSHRNFPRPFPHCFGRI